MCLTGKTGQPVASLVGVELRPGPDKSRAKCRMKQQQCPLQRQGHATPKFVMSTAKWEVGKSGLSAVYLAESRFRPIDIEPVGNGTECESSVETQECNSNECDIDCEMGEWSEWTECDKSCDSGQQVRSRDVMVQPSGNGAQCELDRETQECNTDPCDVDCKMGDWSDWTECSQTCGRGFQGRSREIEIEPLGNGTKCESNVESQYCNQEECPPVCGTYGDWSDWTECDQPCGPGLKYRFREGLLDQDKMGIVCPPDVESDDCIIQECEVTSKDPGGTERTTKPQEVITEIIAQEPLSKFVEEPCHRLSTKTIFFVPPCEDANLKPTEDVCRSTQNNVVSDAWCQSNCPLRFCLRSYCKCDKYQTLPELSNLSI